MWQSQFNPQVCHPGTGAFSLARNSFDSELYVSCSELYWGASIAYHHLNWGRSQQPVVSKAGKRDHVT
eukprot:9531371-Lingulodinium_polyedra.AAC.1